MKLLVVDDHEIFRRGVRSLLLEHSDFVVCGEAIDGQDAIEKARDLKPDLIVMDVSMPRLNGLEATRQIRRMLPDSEVLILSQHESPEMARQALKAGARGYVVKGSVSKDLISALSTISRREYFFDSAIMDPTPSAHIDLQEILQRSVAFERALRESERQLRNLVNYQSAVMNNMAEGLYVLDANGLVTSINRAGEAILGWTKDELLGKKMHDVTHYKYPDGRPFPASECPGLQVAQKGMALREHEDFFIRKDGSYVSVVFSASPLKQDGNIAGVIVSFRDDTEQRSIREALKDSESQLALALDASKTAIFDWDVVSSRGNWNPQMAALYSFQPKDEYITAEEWMGLFHPDDVDRLRTEAAQFWQEGEAFSFEFRTVPRAGQFKWISSHGRIVRAADGKAVRMIGIHSDITDRKQAEQSTNLLAAIVDSSDDAIISKTLDGIITSWNKGAERLFGYLVEEAIGQHIMLIIPPDRHNEELDILDRLRHGQRIDHFETVRRRKDGNLVEVSITISPVKDSQGRIIGASKVARDITPRKQSERALAAGARQQKALFYLADELHRAGSMEEVYNAALNAILNTLQCNRASILLYDDTGVMRFKSWRGLSNTYRAAVNGHSAWSRDDKNPQPVCISDITSADITESLKATIKREGISALAFIPLMSDGKLIGKFMAYFNTPRRFTEVELDLSLTIARQLAFAIERKRSDEALQRSEERFRRLSEDLDTEVSRQTQQIRKLTHYLMSTQDEERRHIARELHDSAGQTLAALGMSLAQLGHDAGRDAPGIAKQLEDVQNLVQQLHREIRTTSYLLHPPLLDESGLPSALNWYIQGLAERGSLSIKLDIAKNFPRLPRNMELAIFRVVQECLTNIHRHSESATASIRLFLEGDTVQVEVADQGKGIPPDRLTEIQRGGSGVGIRGMQERLSQFGGTMKIESTGTGTSVRASMLVPKDPQSPAVVPLQTAV